MQLFVAIADGLFFLWSAPFIQYPFAALHFVEADYDNEFPPLNIGNWIGSCISQTVGQGVLSTLNVAEDWSTYSTKSLKENTFSLWPLLLCSVHI